MLMPNPFMLMFNAAFAGFYVHKNGRFKMNSYIQKIISFELEDTLHIIFHFSFHASKLKILVYFLPFPK